MQAQHARVGGGGVGVARTAGGLRLAGRVDVRVREALLAIAALGLGVGEGAGKGAADEACGACTARRDHAQANEAHSRRPQARAGRAMLLTAATLARLVAVAEALPLVLLHKLLPLLPRALVICDGGVRHVLVVDVKLEAGSEAALLSRCGHRRNGLALARPPTA